MAINFDQTGKRDVTPISPIEQNLNFAEAPEPHVSNKKTSTILPLSGSEKNRKNTPQRRKDLATRGRVLAFGLVSVGALSFLGHSFYYLAQPEQVTDEHITAVSQRANGNTGFNKENGEDIAVGYVKAYLSIKTDENADKLLAWYLSGDKMSSTETSNTSVNNIRTATANVAEQVIGVPRVIRITPHANPALMTYRVTALVKPSATGTNNSIKDASKSANQVSELKQITMSVTVAFDSKTGRYYIATPNPSILPSPVMGKSSALIPSQQVQGGKIQNSAETDAVIQGFVKAYVAASPEKHGDLDQYVVEPNKITLATAGFGGEFTVNTNSISYQLYQQDDKSIIARTTLTLVDELGGTTDVESNESTKQSISYTVTYNIKLVQQGNGKYLVSDLSPDIYDVPTQNVAQAG
jgi:hypothetical protein